MCELPCLSVTAVNICTVVKSQTPCGGPGRSVAPVEGYEILKCLLPLAKLISELTETSEEQSLLNN